MKTVWYWLLVCQVLADCLLYMCSTMPPNWLWGHLLCLLHHPGSKEPNQDSNSHVTGNPHWTWSSYRSHRQCLCGQGPCFQLILSVRILKELRGPRSFEGHNLPTPCYREPIAVLPDTSLKSPLLPELSFTVRQIKKVRWQTWGQFSLVQHLIIFNLYTSYVD